LVRSESFWAVAKVRSPHTGPEFGYPRGRDRVSLIVLVAVLLVVARRDRLHRHAQELVLPVVVQLHDALQQHGAGGLCLFCKLAGAGKDPGAA